ncbi:hypothetical protein F2Q69_00011197 [Brassica cretica]|uniref:Nucleotide-diphospho-sugar transferase domain-containing protein n=1 Tax=Brassica cretica TaxID=69181 RepID=A0A8S9R3A1_BRACR|nr:hypothetical protein F2Q69_00011197 [Brassica cretica]
MVEGWRNGSREATNSKPLFVTIYATVIIGVLVSSFYVFSAIYSPTNGSTSWLSSPPLSTAGRIRQAPQENATFQTPVGPPPPHALPLPSPEEAEGKSLGKIWVSPPREKKMPPLETFKLTKELFGAMDTKLLESLYWKGVPVFDMGSHMSTVDVGWGSPTFHKMGREKVILVDSVLPFGYELLMCDTDMSILELKGHFTRADYLEVDERKNNRSMRISADDRFHEIPRQMKINIDRSAGRISQSPQENATFQTPVVPPPPRELPLPSPEEAQGKSLGAMDTKLLEALYWKGVPVFDMGSHMSTVDVGWGSPTFHKMGREKVILIDSVLPFGYELLMCDTDMVWLKNPLPYLARYPEADVLTSSDQVVPTVVDDSLDIWQQVGAAYNIGIFHWRPTESAKKLAKEWKEMLLADDKVWDQNGFNEIVRKQLGPSVDGDSGLFYAYDGNLKVGILPASIFCSGHTYFVQAMYQQLRLEPYALHTTFQYAGTEGKRHRLREGMVFFDPPEYYDAPGGFISFKPSIPKSLLLDRKHTIESHFTLVNHQMKQIRSALAIASLLNRTLVMPPIWCRLDRLWFGHPGTLVGSMTRQPFICPLDHVFEVNIMLKELPEDEFGPGIGIREYSFLDNPALPKQVKDSWLDVQLCQEGKEGCEATNITTPSGFLKFPKRSNEDTGREERFRRRVKRYVGIWCCEENKTPGHIYYDMYWDEKPGWKPVPPQTPEEDHPPV